MVAGPAAAVSTPLAELAELLYRRAEGTAEGSDARKAVLLLEKVAAGIAQSSAAWSLHASESMVADPLAEGSSRAIAPVQAPRRQVESMLRMSQGSVEEQDGPESPLEEQVSHSRLQCRDHDTRVRGPLCGFGWW